MSDAALAGVPARHPYRSTLVGSVVVILLLLAAPQVVYPVFVMKLMCYALFAAAFDLLFGYVGLLSFGHAAFLGTGAYLAAEAAGAWGFSPLMSLATAMVSAAVLGSAIGFLAIRRKGIEFGMITLALAELVNFVAQRAPFTGGENGIQGVPRGHLFGVIDLNVPENMYLFVLAIFLLGMFAIWRTIHSPFGHILQAIRDHESRAISLGYNVGQFKLIAFVVSAALAGLAGGLKALVFQIATLDDVSFHTSGAVVLMALLGGVRAVLRSARRSCHRGGPRKCAFDVIPAGARPDWRRLRRLRPLVSTRHHRRNRRASGKMIEAVVPDRSVLPPRKGDGR